MDSNQPQQGLFSLSLQSFAETLTEEQKSDFEFSTLEDFRTAIIVIQNRQSSVRKMRNLARLTCFLEAMDQFSKVIKLYVNASELVCFIWGPAKFLLQIASAYTEAFDALLDSYQQIGESLPLLSQYQALFQRNPSMRRVLSLIYNDILEFHKKALKYFRQRTWRQLFHATWKTFRAEFSGLLSNMQRHGRLIESQANLIEFEQLFQQMEMGRAAAKADFQKRTEEEERNRRVVVRNWLSAASTDVDQEKGVTTRKGNPGSGRWLLDNNQLQAWYNPEFCSAPLLWINGIPGAGKTVLASLIVEELEQLRQNHAVALGFFYCKHKDSQRSTFNNVARAILAQLLNQNGDLLPYLFEKASTSGEVVLESPTLTKDLLEIALKSSEKVYIVIDGLDECGSHEKKAIITWFQAIVAALADTEFDSIRCLFISQDDGEVGKLLSKIPTIHIRPEDTRADIETYATLWSKKIQEKFDLLDAKRDKILSIVIERANGMFLFAKLVMEHLFSQTKREYLNKELEPDRFPHGLEDAYARIVDRILGDPSTKEDARRLLGWLVCAKRPLKWREIQCAASINLEANDIDLAERQLRVDSKILCGSLVEQRSDDTVEMVHLTARFFLVNQKHINLASEEFDLAKLCLGYLNFQCFRSSIPDSEIEDFVLKGYYSFVDYAALHWVDHLEEWIPNDDHKRSVLTIKNLIQEFLQNFWWKPKNGTVVPSEVRLNFEKFKACEFVQQLTKVAFNWKKLQKTYGADSVNSENVQLVERICRVRRVLENTFAASQGNDTLERNLISFYGPTLFKCARISCKHFTDGFPTYKIRDQHFQKHNWSFSCTYPGCPFGTLGFNSARDLNRHLETFHELRQYEETQFPLTTSPGDIDIKRAIRAASVQEVEKWLEQFSEVEETAPFSKIQHSAILGAVNQGDEHIFKLLLEGSPNISTTEISSLSNIALEKGQFSIARDLLRHPRANPFDLSGKYESPVTIAIQLGNIEILNLIDDDENTDWNSRINTKSSSSKRRWNEWTTPLLLAATCGNVKVVNFLIEKEGLSLNPKDAHGRTPFWLASDKSHLEVVKLFIEKKGVDIDFRNANNRTPLSWATGNGHLDVVKLLIENKGIDMSSRDSNGRTPLSWAAGNGHFEAVKLLIEKEGLDMNSVDSSSRSPISWAAGNGHLEVLQLLIGDEGADINSADLSGRTPFSWAAEKGHIKVLQLLIDINSVDISSRDSNGRTPFSWAAGNGHFEAVKLLIEKEGLDMNSVDSSSRSPISWAAGNGHLRVLQLLIENGGIDINSRDSTGRTTLSWATESRNLEVVKFLIEIEGLDPNSKVHSGHTLLSWAVRNDHLEIVKFLIEKKGVDICSVDSNGRTPLSWAADGRNLDVVKLLVKKEDWDCNLQFLHGQTPLCWAAANGYVEVVRLLVEKAGVDADSKDSNGRTPLSLAAGSGHIWIVKLLDEKGVNLESTDNSALTPLSWAAANGHVEVVRLLVENAGVDADSKDSSGRTPLSWAAGNGYVDVVKLLGEKGVCIDSRDFNGRTPLWSAARNGKLDVLRMLIEREDIDADVKDSNGRTPLWWAVGNGHLDAVKLLIEKGGVNLGSKDSSGRTPLAWAAENRHLRIVELLEARLYSNL